ncbi:transcriptional regulator, Crp/Fnr family [Labilithrix luteola]|uniref:Transcriptional regulator, Crp/Fnr family n=1 Tax=Labilithrix luteola TaxID=1391654 RepID=A0A0K1PVX9_9BACT|nr:cyclic nucleotide-binding domain-containing protein [Labilithrix luteola]AKU97677.1 transcriptional regulator, Crp/Fnr family [Labilithrix luteola]
MNQDVLDLFSRADSPQAALRNRVLLLRSVESLQGLDEQGLTLFAEHATNRFYRKGDVLTTEDEQPRAIGIVIEGQVTVTRTGKPGYVARRGEGFGMLAVMASTTTGRVVADIDTVTLEIPVATFRVALEENFSLLRNCLRIMGTTLTRARHHLPADPSNPPSVDLGDYYVRPRTLPEQLIQLRRGPFHQMNVEALVDLTRRMKERRVPAGHVFWSAGEPSTFALHVEYGRVRCTAPDGQHVDVGHDFTLGVMDVWSGQPRSYEARAETPIIAYHIDYEDFLVIIEMHVSVGLDMLRGIARQYLATDKSELG